MKSPNGKKQAEPRLAARLPHPRIGVLPTGHQIYWSQFPGLQERCKAMWEQFRAQLETIGTVIAPEIVDTPEKALEAGVLFAREEIDLLLIFPLGYTTGMVVAPAVQQLHCPLRILNAHLDSSYKYATADTAEYLFHEGPCCVPEYAATLVSLGKPFLVRTGHFGQAHFWEQINLNSTNPERQYVSPAVTYKIVQRVR